MLLLLSITMAYAQRPTISGTPISSGTSIGKPSSSSSSSKTTTSSARSNINNADTTSHNEAVTGIDYSHKEESEASLTGAVFQYRMQSPQVKILRVWNPSLEPTGVAYPDIQEAVDAPFSLSAWGLGRPRLQMNPLLNIDWMGHNQQTMTFYQVRRPYTSLAFGGSLNSDNQFHGVHTQNITPRWNMAVNYDLYVREGVYTRTALKNHFFNVTSNYYSRDNRYQVQGGIVYTRLDQQENGGIESDDFFYSTSSTTRAGVPVNLYNAANQWRQTELFAHQTYNTVRQVTAVRPRVVSPPPSDSTRQDTVVYDTLYAAQPHVLNTGVFGLNLNYQHAKRRYTDGEPSSSYYDSFFVSDSIVSDSTVKNHLSARVYWTNDAYLDSLWHNPFKVYGGVDWHLRSVNYSSLDSSWWTGVEPFAKADILLGRSSLTVKASAMLSDHPEGGDRRIEASYVVPVVGGHLTLEGRLSQQAAPWFYYRYFSNNFQWQNVLDEGAKENRKIVTAQHHKLWYADDTSRRRLSTQVGLTAAHQQGAYYLDSGLQPRFDTRAAWLGQLECQAELQQGWFNYQGHLLLQHSTDADFLRVPVLATKNSFFADMTLFKDALRVQTGFDVRYHTRYFADAYHPALATFYRQDDVQVGGYLWLDYFLTLKVRQANIYLRVVHLNSLWENIDVDVLGHHFTNTTDYMTLPHVPGEDLAVYFGVIWRFFD